jgi:hypothetical protein
MPPSLPVPPSSRPTFAPNTSSALRLPHADKPNRHVESATGTTLNFKAMR